jgi:hypothetical protein
MIIILLFATFVSLFFQSTQYTIKNREYFDGGNDLEGEDNQQTTNEPNAEGEEQEPLVDTPADDEVDEVDETDEVDLTNAQTEADNNDHTVTKAAKLKKDMKDYFAVQEKLLDVLEKAEPLQQEAMAIKERFNNKVKK